MEKILVIRQKLENLFLSYDIYIIPVVKALTALVIMLTLKSQLGYSDIMQRWNVIALICLVCSLLPWSFITCVSAAALLLHLAALSWEAAVLAMCFIFLAALLQYLFLPGHSLAIVLIPVAFFLRIPYVIPLVLGLVGEATAFIPAGCGVLFYYFIVNIQKNAAYLTDTAISGADAVERITQLLTGLRDNRLMLLSILAFCVTTAAVYLIRKLQNDYAPYIALAVGLIVNIVVFLTGGFMLELSISYAELFIGGFVSLLLAVLVAFWRIAVDYSRTEYLQYEDDDYIYYVKAVPKINMTIPDRKVREINSRVGDESEDGDIREALQILEAMDEDEKGK